MRIRVLPADPQGVVEAARAIRSHGVVAVPTDTVYGLACDPSSDDAVQKLFEVKNREAKPIPLLCASYAVAERFVEMNETSKKLASLHWPGALTIVAPLRREAELSPLLDQGTGYLGVRVPDSEVCVALAREVGGATTGTSANLSGRPSCRTARQVVESLDGRIKLVIDGGPLQGRESTVVRVSRSTVEVLREGSIRIQDGELRA